MFSFFEGFGNRRASPPPPWLSCYSLVLILFYVIYLLDFCCGELVIKWSSHILHSISKQALAKLITAANSEATEKAAAVAIKLANSQFQETADGSWPSTSQTSSPGKLVVQEIIISFSFLAEVSLLFVAVLKMDCISINELIPYLEIRQCMMKFHQQFICQDLYFLKCAGKTVQESLNTAGSNYLGYLKQYLACFKRKLPTIMSYYTLGEKEFTSHFKFTYRLFLIILFQSNSTSQS